MFDIVGGKTIIVPMAQFIDTKYINLLSPRLDRFQWKKSNLAACRCPICGDSSKSKTKIRFYFYEKGGNFFVRCHNCDYSTTLGGLIRHMDGNLYKQYCFENLKNKNDNGLYSHVKQDKLRKKPTPPENSTLNEIPKLSKLPPSHPAVEWARTRKIPKTKLDLLYYANNFAEWVSHIDPDANVGDDGRVVIPIFSSTGVLIGAQGRILGKSQTHGREVRYITIKADKDIGRLWYGLERIDTDRPLIVVEGPIDSLFLTNCVAMLGLSDPLNIPVGIPTDKIIYALDNEPRNKQVVEAMETLIEAGKSVCIWSPRVDGIKDINDMVLNGIHVVEIESIIRECTLSGLSAKLAMKAWKRV